MPPKVKLPPNVERNRAKGRWYYSVRVKGVRLGKLPSDPDSPEFYEQYAAIMRRVAADPKPVKHAEGSVAWLIQAYKASPGYMKLAAATRVSYAKALDRLAAIGTFPAAEVRRKHINALRDALASTPRTRQLFGQVCSALFNYGIREHDLEMLNPARLMKRDGEAESYLDWTAEQMALFEASNPPLHVMTAYMVARYTGPRRGDIVALMRSHYTGSAITVAGSKNQNPVTVPVHYRLKTYLDALPPSLYLITDAAGRPIRPERLSKDMRRYLDSIGLTDLHLHGLRHTAGKALAEAGCSPHEIAAVLGHKTLQMVERYTKKARQMRMAGSAVVKLERNRDET
jgi:integrase